MEFQFCLSVPLLLSFLSTYSSSGAHNSLPCLPHGYFARERHLHHRYQSTRPEILLCCTLSRFLFPPLSVHYWAGFSSAARSYVYIYPSSFLPGFSPPLAICVIAWETREEQNEGPPFNLPSLSPSFVPSFLPSFPPSPYRAAAAAAAQKPHFTVVSHSVFPFVRSTVRPRAIGGSEWVSGVRPPLPPSRSLSPSPLKPSSPSPLLSTRPRGPFSSSYPSRRPFVQPLFRGPRPWAPALLPFPFPNECLSLFPNLNPHCCSSLHIIIECRAGKGGSSLTNFGIKDSVTAEQMNEKLLFAQLNCVLWWHFVTGWVRFAFV